VKFPAGTTIRLGRCLPAAAKVRFMLSQRDLDRRNDVKFLTPLLLMALILACGVLFYAYTGHSLAATG